MYFGLWFHVESPLWQEDHEAGRHDVQSWVLSDQNSTTQRKQRDWELEAEEGIKFPSPTQ